MNYAELKRKLTVGTKLTLLESNIPNHKYLNTTRKIVKQQTNGIRLEGGSWLGLGSTGEKAEDFSFQNNGFTLEKGDVKLVYRIN